ncbi:MAG: hypothetical protein HPM95_07395 [Alphaproteobacteria bacterium]|nr:hypothetical protein [Alphaproteobacteria bacterium]
MRHDHGSSCPEPPAPRAEPFHPDTETGSAASANGLLEALVHVARVHGLSPSADAILSAVAADPEGLTLAGLEEAADGLGLRTHVARLSWRRIPQVSLPAIVFDADGSAVVLTGGSRATRKLKSSRRRRDRTPYGRGRQLRRRRGASSASFWRRPLAVKPIRRGRRLCTQRGHWFWSAVRRLWPTIPGRGRGADRQSAGTCDPALRDERLRPGDPQSRDPDALGADRWVVLALLMDFALKILRTRIVDDAGRRGGYGGGRPDADKISPCGWRRGPTPPAPWPIASAISIPCATC